MFHSGDTRHVERVAGGDPAHIRAVRVSSADVQLPDLLVPVGADPDEYCSDRFFGCAACRSGDSRGGYTDIRAHELPDAARHLDGRLIRNGSVRFECFT